MNRKSTLFFLFVSALAAPAFAQNDSGRLAGTVADSAGASVSAATVTNQRTGEVRIVFTTDAGMYIIPQLALRLNF